jgi:hypothetical protein
MPWPLGTVPPSQIAAIVNGSHGDNAGEAEPRRLPRPANLSASEAHFKLQTDP